MERKFFMNDFEESLKDHADQFKMIPSKKVWHGIYNDLHPGRRWPSITISLLLIFILLGVGYLNTNNSAQPASANSKKTIALNNSLVNKQKKIEQNHRRQQTTIRFLSKMPGGEIIAQQLRDKQTQERYAPPRIEYHGGHDKQRR